MESASEMRAGKTSDCASWYRRAGELTGSPAHWHTNTNVCSLSWNALDRERPAQLRDPLVHGAQPEVSWERACRVKASPVIGYLQDDLIGISCQPQGNHTGTGVLDDIVECLLHNAVQRLFHLHGERGFFPQVRLDGQFVAGAQDGHLPGERCHQSLDFQ